MATSQDFVNWVCGDSLDPIYLMTALLVSRPNLRSLSTGSTHKTIYMRVAEKFRVLLPPMDLQHLFAGQVTDGWKLLDSLERAVEESNHLFSSLQQKAFQGEL
jgi:type I restriction enzyme S subunit